MPHAITVENVSKDFRFLVTQAPSIKSILINASRGKFEFGKIQRFKALKNINFRVKKGEFLGIMGRNGAGKSTLMKLISGIYTPSQGKIFVDGRIAPLIELGAGFHGDLSGEENIFLNAAILGVGRKAAQEALPKILEFADIGDFIKMPVRTYSSGMTVRLGFAIAIHLEAPILLLDEVLGVGDQGLDRRVGGLDLLGEDQDAPGAQGLVHFFDERLAPGDRNELQGVVHDHHPALLQLFFLDGGAHQLTGDVQPLHFLGGLLDHAGGAVHPDQLHVLDAVLDRESVHQGQGAAGGAT